MHFVIKKNMLRDLLAHFKFGPRLHVPMAKILKFPKCIIISPSITQSHIFKTPQKNWILSTIYFIMWNKTNDCEYLQQLHICFILLNLYKMMQCEQNTKQTQFFQTIDHSPGKIWYSENNFRTCYFSTFRSNQAIDSLRSMS